MKVDTGLSRRQFFARMRKEGFARSPLQLTRIGLSYSRGGCMVTVPKHHMERVIITGGPKEWNGVWCWEGCKDNVPSDLGFENVLDVILAVIRGQLVTEVEI